MRPIHQGRLEDGDMNAEGLSCPWTRCRSPSSRRISNEPSFTHGFKNPRLFAHRASRLSDAFPLLRGIVFLKSFIEKPYEKDAVEYFLISYLSRNLSQRG